MLLIGKKLPFYAGAPSRWAVAKDARGAGKPYRYENGIATTLFEVRATVRMGPHGPFARP
jgi:hypothetical protein